MAIGRKTIRGTPFLRFWHREGAPLLGYGEYSPSLCSCTHEVGTNHSPLSGGGGKHMFPFLGLGIHSMGDPHFLQERGIRTGVDPYTHTIPSTYQCHFGSR